MHDLLAAPKSQRKPRSRAALYSVPQDSPSWWVQINTSVPLCTYYFGPFDNPTEARVYRAGYVEDLEQEGARDIVALVKQCHQPSLLTIDEGYYCAKGKNHSVRQ